MAAPVATEATRAVWAARWVAAVVTMAAAEVRAGLVSAEVTVGSVVWEEGLLVDRAGGAAAEARRPPRKQPSPDGECPSHLAQSSQMTCAVRLDALPPLRAGHPCSTPGYTLYARWQCSCSTSPPSCGE